MYSFSKSKLGRIDCGDVDGRRLSLHAAYRVRQRQQRLLAQCASVVQVRIWLPVRQRLAVLARMLYFVYFDLQNCCFTFEYVLVLCTNDNNHTKKCQFYAVMCGIYALFALSWLAYSLYYRNDLVRIQIWIGGVILLGLMEMTAYLVEYEQIHKTGLSARVAMIVVEVISCMKRSSARMLVIVISLGFDIIK